VKFLAQLMSHVAGKNDQSAAAALESSHESDASVIAAIIQRFGGSTE
jgi:hypothetical protein